MARGATLFNLMARRYSRAPIADMASYEKKLAITRKYLTPESEVFEFGCGTGSTALLHAPYVKHIHGTDYATKMIEIANEKRAEAGVQNATFAVDNIDTLEISEARYDAILGLNILHLLENVDNALQKVHTLLKPGGYFISSSVCMTRPPGVFRFILPVMGFLQIFPRIESMNEEQLLDKFRRAGFTLEEQWNPDGEIKVVFLVARKPV